MRSVTKEMKLGQKNSKIVTGLTIFALIFAQNIAQVQSRSIETIQSIQSVNDLVKIKNVQSERNPENTSGDKLFAITSHVGNRHVITNTPSRMSKQGGGHHENSVKLPLQDYLTRLLQQQIQNKDLKSRWRIRSRKRRSKIKIIIKKVIKLLIFLKLFVFK